MPGTVDRGETSAKHNFAIGLQCERLDLIVRACAWIETGVQRPVGVQPGDSVAAAATVLSECAAPDDFSIRLQGDGENLVVKTAVVSAARLERGVRESPLGQSGGERAKGQREEKYSVCASPGVRVHKIMAVSPIDLI